MDRGLSGGSVRPGLRMRAVDDEVGDVDALRRQLARHALRQPAQRELAHRERRRLRIALDARRGAGEQDRAVPARQHAPDRLLRDQEAAERAAAIAAGPPPGRDRRTARAAARPRCRRRRRARRSPARPRRTAAPPRRARWHRRRTPARRSRRTIAASLSGLRAASATAHAFAREQPGERGAEAGTGADDESGLGLRCFRSRPLLCSSHYAAATLEQWRPDGTARMVTTASIGSP